MARGATVQQGATWGFFGILQAIVWPAYAVFSGLTALGA